MPDRQDFPTCETCDHWQVNEEEGSPRWNKCARGCAAWAESNNRTPFNFGCVLHSDFEQNRKEDA